MRGGGGGGWLHSPIHHTTVQPRAGGGGGEGHLSPGASVSREMTLTFKSPGRFNVLMFNPYWCSKMNDECTKCYVKTKAREHDSKITCSDEL